MHTLFLHLLTLFFFLLFFSASHHSYSNTPHTRPYTLASLMSHHVHARKPGYVADILLAATNICLNLRLDIVSYQLISREARFHL